MIVKCASIVSSIVPKKDTSISLTKGKRLRVLGVCTIARDRKLDFAMNDDKLLSALVSIGKRIDKVSEELERLSIEVKRISAHTKVQSEPLDDYVAGNYFHFSKHHFAGHYDKWRLVRINKVLELFGVDYFKGKKILELGAGHGDMGAFFCELGANVLCLEGRLENAN